MYDNLYCAIQNDTIIYVDRIRENKELTGLVVKYNNEEIIISWNNLFKLKKDANRELERRLKIKRTKN
jgi:hypothetical protein